MSTTTATAKILDRNRHVITSPRGVDAWGLYFEFVEVNMSGAIIWYNRIFVAGNTVSRYRRQTNTTRTTWKLYRQLDHAKALETARKMLNAGIGRNVLRGAPILVQLEPVDVEAIATGKIPGARYRGNNRHEQLNGKLELMPNRKAEAFDIKGVEAAVLILAAPAVEPY